MSATPSAGLHLRVWWSPANKDWTLQVSHHGLVVQELHLPRVGQAAAWRAGKALLELEKIKRGLP